MWHQMPYWTELLSSVKMHLQSEASRPRERWGQGRGGHVHHMRWCLKLIKQRESTAIFQQSIVFHEAWCRSLKVKEHVTPTAPWETRTVLVGRGQGSPCWSRWARWLDAADRGSEAGRWREDRPERAETRGRVPCCRRAGSTWFQQGSAPLDAFQSPARSRANTHDSGLSLGLLFSVKTVDPASKDAQYRATEDTVVSAVSSKGFTCQL